MDDVLLDVKVLKKHFAVNSGWFSRRQTFVYAVDGVSFQVQAGETLGLVGESGCGKSTLGRCLLKLIEPTAGEVRYDGVNILTQDRDVLKALRKKFQIIFQDPFSSLKPRMTVEEIVGDALKIHGISNRRDRKERVADILQKVGLQGETLNRYPHQFSGGQRQRIGIARALALNPELIVCDEPVSALDVSIQSQVINLLDDLQEEFNLTYLFIAHDLSVVEHVSNRVAVMYLGRIVELASSLDLYNTPLHPYTQALLAASPIPDPTITRERKLLEGDVPSPINPPKGCHFHTRCPHTSDICRREPPPVWEEIEANHWARCWRVKEI